MRYTAATRHTAATAMATRRERMPMVLRVAWPSVLAAVILVAVAAWLAWQRGGYFPPAFLAAGAVAFVATGALGVVWPPRPLPPGAAPIGAAAGVGEADRQLD